MRVVIQGHSANEIRRYRLLKAGIAVALTPLAVVTLRADPLVVQRVERIVPGPVLPLNDAMRDDFSISWATGGTGRLRKFGVHSLVGQGPANAQATIFNGENEIAKTRTDEKGFWRATVTLDKPGLKSFTARFHRQGIGSGRTVALAATILDPNGKSETDVTITNLTPNDRVLAGFFTLRGSAPPGDFVQVYIDATLLGRAEVDLAGRWSYKPKISSGGRRTFTVVDEITERQFGPLPVIVTGKAAPKPAPAKKSAPAKKPAPVKKAVAKAPAVKRVAAKAVAKAKPKKTPAAKRVPSKWAQTAKKRAAVGKPPKKMANRALPKRIPAKQPAKKVVAPAVKGAKTKFRLTATPVTPVRPLN